MKLKIDIIMLSTFDKDAGGRETWLYNFLPELLKDNIFERVNLYGFKTSQDSNYKKELLKLDPKTQNRRTLYPYILEGIVSRWPKAFSMFRGLKRIPAKEIPNNVLAMGVFEMVMINRLIRYNKSKKIVWLRSIFSQEKAYKIPKILRKTFLIFEINQLKKADVLICNGDDIRDFYKPYGLNLSVIKNGVNIGKWEMPEPELTPPLRIAYVGRLSHVKGIEDFFKLAEKIKGGQHKDEFEFHVVGQSGTYINQVYDLANNNTIVYHNVISNDKLPEFLKSIDVCVALTYASPEGGGGGTSNAMLEQMAAGRLMLAWDNAIFNQYLNEKNAYLATQFSIDELALNLIEILENRNKARLKCIESKKTIEPYTLKSNYVKFKSLLTERVHS
jgi:glycosyltransferase involved in cell wall biosynthesis